ncbi:hypothetical protein EHV15_35360 [Paenibacillus oralis]|uniref:SMC hinge domain-containing protein n=1 Tax=Paenibacillus oralis TaxID=2490856 RepID=A0A3P3TBE8_9BACL|nr:hypothetical protein [Paenibacillus oralis]RRJ54854.1 hypothetical protein EHV15_35360 [Paenibacillus oralis]
MDKPPSVEEIKASLLQWGRKKEALESRREALKELMESYEGFAKGARDILLAKRRGTLSGICGVIAELVTVPEKYEISIETILDSSAQHIVTETEDSARAAISYLKARQLGRAAFLPLNRIKGKSISEDDKQKVSNTEGYIGLAIDLISFDPKYREVINHLIGNVIITDNLSSADNILKNVKQQYRVVTLEGDLINIGGAVIGGSLPLRSMRLLSRQRQIAELDRQIIEVERVISELKVQLL